MRVEPRWRGALRSALLCLVALLTSAAASAQDKRILLLYDEDKTLPGLAVLDQSLRSTFSARLGAGVEFFTESMNLSQFTDEQYEETLREHFARKYRDQQLDLVVGVMGPALGFLLRHGDAVFPGVPMIFCGADAGDLQGVTLPAHVTGILLKRAFAPTLEIVLGLQPETRHVVVIGGTSPFDRHLLDLARSELQAFENRVSFEYLTEQPMGELTSAVSRLAPHTVILFVTFFRDGAGRAYVPHEAVAQLAASANVPVYVFVDQYLGSGTVGGHLYSIEQHGNSAGELGVRVLRGEPPASIPVRELQSSTNMFDARQIARWRLDERRLPAQSVLRFREPTIWDQYGWYIFGGLTLLVGQTLLIAGLLVQRVQRRRAEEDLRCSLERIRDLGRRLINAQETERAHLAREIHDDISQQMAVLQIDLGRLMSRPAPSSVRSLAHLVADTSARAAAVTSSLRDLSHRLHPGHLRLVGLTTALGELERELSTSHTSVAFSHENVPSTLSPDLMLCLYRVAQEAIGNAVRHSRARAVSVHVRGTADAVVMTIHDDGVGFDIRAAQRGLGLMSMRERIEQVGGTLQIDSECGRGTHLEVTVPRGAAGTVEALAG
jgi:signal transduction histidine kinase